ncbi:hypothetical protein LY632_01475 [Erythrobacter sp. SDW2]|uniref:hypothetical protein n=1 Tax=Erythrobacter sp. SDW2 TaxID=2907154 RepID=UPI001F349C64|nr:hypothetical protein [Erythrobacter sp. SDW2]UIP07099.1 hypothetical protein LY632_01475 [Erythrobacter sp. SDW2]
MKNYMFQSKGGALVFVGLTLASVAALVGTEDEDGALTSATSQIEEQGEQFRSQADAAANPDPDPDPVMVEVENEGEFSSDADLVLDPIGFEPVGMEPSPDANDSEVVEVIEEPASEEAIVEQSAE